MGLDATAEVDDDVPADAELILLTNNAYTEAVKLAERDELLDATRCTGALARYIQRAVSVGRRVPC